jgi:hypothetical protein
LVQGNNGGYLRRILRGLKIIPLNKWTCVAYGKPIVVQLNKELYCFLETKYFIIVFTEPVN